ncbi:MAG: PD-(D/E)XK nuclease family protein [Bacteroidetes bacterium]|nr:PD-(D/E)XK nuclease family protein [Bacteroidota bacterium]
MNQTKKNTIVVLDRHCYISKRLDIARECSHGTQIMMMSDLAVRLAGGFIKAVDIAFLRAIIHEVLVDTNLGSLNNIKDLPGFVGAATNTLNKAWLSGFDLDQPHERVKEVSQLNDAVCKRLPASMLPPQALINVAYKNLNLAPVILGPVNFIGMTELHPCWWPLIEELSHYVPVTWVAGPRHIPHHLPKNCTQITEPNQSPQITTVSCSTPYHEAIEAMRWARQLVTQEGIHPQDIAIATTDTKVYDDFFIALREESDLPLYFAHGVNVTQPSHGQSTLALADLLLRGISSDRIFRLSSHKQFLNDQIKELRITWRKLTTKIHDINTLSPNELELRIQKLIANEKKSTYFPLLSLLDEISKNSKFRLDNNPVLNLNDHIEMKQSWLQTGEKLLSGAALKLWNNLLKVSPAASFEQEILRISVREPPEFCERVAWMPAQSLAASPRQYVRLLGLNSYHWPRENIKDLLLTGPGLEDANQSLDPLPMYDADQRDFSTICQTTSKTVICSFSRYDADGKILGRSHLLSSEIFSDTIELFRNSVPSHAMSQSDQLLASPTKFRTTPRAAKALTCWNNWRNQKITEHDGLIKDNHPMIQHLLSQPASATSLTRMLRSPLGYIWHYGLHWRGMNIRTDSLTFNPMNYGVLVHRVLQNTLHNLEVNRQSPEPIPHSDSISDSLKSTFENWESIYGTPPKLLWEETKHQIESMTRQIMDHFPSTQHIMSFCEVPFGGAKSGETQNIPWDSDLPVYLPGTDIKITGFIDRIDIDTGSLNAQLTDYKTGKPNQDSGLNGGQEIQRCIYYVAANSLLNKDYEISPSLLYLKNNNLQTLSEPRHEYVEHLSKNVNEAKKNLKNGHVLFGATPKTKYDLGIYGDFKLALPADLLRGYVLRKEESQTQRLGEMLQEFWKTD